VGAASKRISGFASPSEGHLNHAKEDIERCADQYDQPHDREAKPQITPCHADIQNWGRLARRRKVRWETPRYGGVAGTVVAGLNQTTLADQERRPPLS